MVKTKNDEMSVDSIMDDLGGSTKLSPDVLAKLAELEKKMDEDVTVTDYPENFIFREVGDQITGLLVKSEVGIGKYNQNVYTIQSGDGKKFSVWGTTVIVNEMDSQEVVPGDVVGIKFLGETAGENGRYKNFVVKKL